MVGQMIDCVTRPLEAIDYLFQRVTDGNASGPFSSEEQVKATDDAVRTFFERHLNDEGALTRIPELNAVSIDRIPANTLVRFRGMVQDMFNPEYYAAAYQDPATGTWRCTMYRDALAQPIPPSAKTEIRERRPLYCVPIPGESDWSVEAARSAAGNCSLATGTTTAGAAANREKRRREDGALADDDVMAEANDACCHEADHCHEGGPGEDCSGSKRGRGATGDQGQADRRLPAWDKNLPLPGDARTPCLVKLYDEGKGGDLKLNEIADFIGVLTFDPVLSSHGAAGGELPGLQGYDSMEEAQAHDPPASLLPRLQCILVRKLSVTNVPSAPLAIPTAEQASALRSQVLAFLTAVCGGDQLAAEYLLLVLVSRVYGRADPIPLGSLPLNLVLKPERLGPCSPSDMARRIETAVAALRPLTARLPLSLGTLNAAPLCPYKDYTSDRLVARPLQLADGTLLCVDEIAMSAGKLEPTGVSNLQMLKELVTGQKLEYDFQFYKMPLSVDIPTLIFSEGRSLLQLDVQLPVEAAAISPTTTTMSTTSPATTVGEGGMAQMAAMSVDALLASAGDGALDSWRTYLAAVRELEYSISEPMTKELEQQLVDARQMDRKVGPDEFHRCADV
eukprot:jgi/Mesvir1/21475/Mv03928-RA.4